MNKIGIYKYTNKINGKSYIGQSINIEKRQAQHLYDANYRPERATGIDLAIRKYGIENFDFEILELCNIEELDEKEIYWIAFYNTYHDGYNRTKGGFSFHGEEHPRALLTDEDVWIIREMYNQKVSRRDVYKTFQHCGITARGFKKVWDCENWQHIHADVYTEENKLWHKHNVGHTEDQIGLSSQDRALKQEEIDNIVKDYKNGLSINALAKKYGRDNGVIEKYLANPKEIVKVKLSGRKVKNLNTGLIFDSISKAAKWAGCGATTLTRHLNTDHFAGKVPETEEKAEWEEIFS